MSMYHLSNEEIYIHHRMIELAYPSYRLCISSLLIPHTLNNKSEYLQNRKHLTPAFSGAANGAPMPMRASRRGLRCNAWLDPLLWNATLYGLPCKLEARC